MRVEGQVKYRRSRVETGNRGPLKVLGHPLGINLIQTLNLLLRRQSLVELRTLLEDAAVGPAAFGV
jgi:hypothetical protein